MDGHPEKGSREREKSETSAHRLFTKLKTGPAQTGEGPSQNYFDQGTGGHVRIGVSRRPKPPRRIEHPAPCTPDVCALNGLEGLVGCRPQTAGFEPILGELPEDFPAAIEDARRRSRRHGVGVDVHFQLPGGIKCDAAKQLHALGLQAPVESGQLPALDPADQPHAEEHENDGLHRQCQDQKAREESRGTPRHVSRPSASL